jgi:hypothetical protein
MDMDGMERRILLRKKTLRLPETTTNNHPELSLSGRCSLGCTRDRGRPRNAQEQQQRMAPTHRQIIASWPLCARSDTRKTS